MTFDLDAKEFHIKLLDKLPDDVDESQVFKIHINTLSEWLGKLNFTIPKNMLNKVEGNYVEISYDVVVNLMFGIFPFYSGSKGVKYGLITKEE